MKKNLLHPDPKITRIRQVPLFAECSSDELEEISAVADEATLAAGRRLTTEGADGQEFVVILGGSAAVLKDQTFVAVLAENSFVGEISLLTGARRTATVVAMTPVDVLVIPRYRFTTLLEHAPHLREAIEAVIPERLAS